MMIVARSSSPASSQLLYTARLWTIIGINAFKRIILNNYRDKKKMSKTEKEEIFNNYNSISCPNGVRSECISVGLDYYVLLVHYKCQV